MARLPDELGRHTGSQDFTFSARPDPLLDREGYFERCYFGWDL